MGWQCIGLIKRIVLKNGKTIILTNINKDTGNPPCMVYKIVCCLVKKGDN